MLYQPENSSKSYHTDIRVYYDYSYVYHMHRDIEYIYVFDGAVTVTVEGKNYPLKKDDSLLVLSNQAHGFQTDGTSCIWIGVFSTDFVTEFMTETAGKQFDDNRIVLSDVDRAYLMTHLFCEHPTTRTELCACFQTVCALFLRDSVWREGSSAVGQSKIHDILAYIDAHFKENITLSDMASALGYEPHYLSRCFHFCFQCNFKQFLNEYRVDISRILISECTERGETPNFSEIAYSCGFQSVRNFNRSYKEYCKTTPSEWVKKIRPKKVPNPKQEDIS